MAALSVSKAWEETSAFLTREARLVAPVALALIAVPGAIQGWINPPTDPASRPMPLVGLFLLLVSMAGQLAIAQLAMGWSGSIGEAIGKGFRRIWKIIGAGLLIYLPIAIVGAVIIVASLGQQGLADIETMTPQQLAEVPGIALTIVVLIIVALFLSARLFPMVAVAMAEEVGVTALIKRSWSLTRGHFGKLLGVILLLVVASMLLSAAVTVVVGALVTLMAGPATAMSVSALLIGLATGMVSALIAAAYAGLIGRIYVQLA